MNLLRRDFLKKLGSVSLALLLALLWGKGVAFGHRVDPAPHSSGNIKWEQRVDKLLKVSKGDIILTAVGDMIFNREISGFKEPHYQDLYRIMRDAHIAYGNLEMSLNERPGKQRGTFNFRQGRDFAWEIAKIGISLVSLANNHALDYGPEGLKDCLRILRQSGISSAGAGSNLSQARAARGKQVYKTKFALLSFMSPGGWESTPEGPTIVRIGAPSVLIEKEDGSTEAIRAPLESDVKAMEDAIVMAKRHADIVIVALHLHWLRHYRAYGIPDKVPPNQTLVIHKAVDAGADIILGTGPHVLRGIEIYKGKPIIYSLGNFIYQWKTPEIPPIIWTRDQETHSGYEGVDPRLKGLDVREESETVVVRFTIREKKICPQIELIPVTLGIERGPLMGSPRLANDKRGKEIIELLQKLSQPYKTKITYKEWYGVVEW